MPDRRSSAALAAMAGLLCAAVAHAEIPSETVPDTRSLGATTPEQLTPPETPQFRFYALLLSRAEATNINAANDLLQGRVLGRLFGSNSSDTSGRTALFAEQRFVPFITIEPKILDHWAKLRASFDINFSWGDSSYGVGGNMGGALSGRQINLETSNVEIEFKMPVPGWSLDVGLQRLWDNVRNPYDTPFSTIATTGNRLAFWGTDAAGVSLYGARYGQRYKFGAYVPYENKVDIDDHVLLFEAVMDQELRRGWHIGGSVRYVRDTSSGAGGVSVLGQGPASSLTDFMGAFRFPVGMAKYHLNLAWVGLDASVNPEFTGGRFGGSAFVVSNLGQLDSQQPSGQYEKAASIYGLAADIRAGYRFGRTRNDVALAEVIFTSGDQDGIKDGNYTGVITGNTYGTPGAIFATSGTYLLMAQINVVNRSVAAVYDISNLGYGLTAGTLNVSYDIFRNLLTAKVGAAAAFSNIAPVGGGTFIGAEANAMLSYRVRVLFFIELHSAYLWLGNFYDSAQVRPAMATGRPMNPWTTFLDLKWVVF